MSLQFLSNLDLYNNIVEQVLTARHFVWIGTADIKDMHVKYKGKVVPFLEILDILVKGKVEIRLLHAKDPGENFKRSFDKYPLLWKSMERQLCPRVHFKIIVIDGKIAYIGSANLTGAGLGMKSENTRNFENGIITDNLDLVDQIMNQFDDVWIGKFCKTCNRKAYCTDPIIS
ncbi:MAG: phospholipase D family protein [Bacteroidales bacterium]|nr:phospholipase D family protein [Bacteroidales bacterium]